MEFSNLKVAKTLRNVATAYVLKNIGNIFQIRAYENAADSIDHSTAEIYDLWQEGKLSSVPNLGEKIQGYLNELFEKGNVPHFDLIEKGIPRVIFEMLDISGVGPKTASVLAEMGVKDLEDLKKKLKSGELVNNGFSAKIAQKVSKGLTEANQRGNRMLLPYAIAQAEKILNYLKKSPDVIQAHPLGSLRRMVATVGDLDFSVSSRKTKDVVEYFCKMPGVTRVVDQGVNKATVVLRGGFQADLLAGEPESYGALLQHFTGSKAHNIKLRTLANKKGLSLSEYGVKKGVRGKGKGEREELIQTETEEELYEMLGMQTPPSEIREDTGEIEAALEHKLPDLVEINDIKGDLHTHSNFPFPHPSHGPGANPIKEIIEKAINLGYEFIGIADHPPGFTSLPASKIIEAIQKRTNFIQKIRQLAESTKSIRVLNGLEVDILSDGSLGVPDEALATLDFCIAGIHSGHSGPKEQIIKRLLSALNNPYVDIISHPTGRILNERESSDADWDEVFRVASERKKILEINAHPVRLDLRDDLVRRAIKFEVKLIINTDAHEVSQMENMRFGVSVARRGWAEKKDIVNTWDWTKFAEWFKLKINK